MSTAGRILVVDDTPVNVKLLARPADGQGLLRSSPRPPGAEALEKINDAAPTSSCWT